MDGGFIGRSRNAERSTPSPVGPSGPTTVELKTTALAFSLLNEASDLRIGSDFTDRHFSAIDWKICNLLRRWHPATDRRRNRSRSP